MKKRLKKMWNYMFPPKKNEFTQWIYKDKFGNNYYEFKTPEMMTYPRLFKIEEFTLYTAQPFQPDELKQTAQKIWDSLNKGKVGDAFILVKALIVKLDLTIIEDAYIGLAALYFVMDGEPLDSPSNEWIEKKKALWKQDPDAYSFFLQKCLQDSKRFLDIPEVDLKQYLEKTKIAAEILSELLKNS
jgi:hypothetical protein